MAITLKTDKQGLAIVDRARTQKNWTALATAWCNAANVSVSTLKRFRERKAIQRDAFIAICQAVDIEDWTQIVSGENSDISILERRYRQSKRIIAEEVLSNLNSLDARLAFVAQTFSDDPAEARRQLNYSPQVSRSHPPATANRGDTPPKKRADISSKNNEENSTSQRQLSLKLEANVSIIQIMMEI